MLCNDHVIVLSMPSFYSNQKRMNTEIILCNQMVLCREGTLISCEVNEPQKMLFTDLPSELL